MLGWSINLFRVRGIQLAVHASFFVLLAWIAYEGWQLAGWIGVIWSVVTLLTFFTCVVLHELGHSFTAMHFGIGVRRILLMPIGGMAEFEEIPRQPMRELLITLAGPAVNFLIAGILWLVVGLRTDAEYPATAVGFAQFILHANLVMGCFNFLPVFPMDGGRILRALLASRMPYLKATFWAARIGRTLALAAIAVILFTSWIPWIERPQDRVLPAILFAFIGVAGEMEYRATRRRDEEDAHWRTVVARLSAAPAGTEPPQLSVGPIGPSQA